MAEVEFLLQYPVLNFATKAANSRIFFQFQQQPVQKMGTRHPDLEPGNEFLNRVTQFFLYISLLGSTFFIRACLHHIVLLNI